MANLVVKRLWGDELAELFHKRMTLQEANLLLANLMDNPARQAEGVFENGELWIEVEGEGSSNYRPCLSDSPARFTLEVGVEIVKAIMPVKPEDEERFTDAFAENQLAEIQKYAEEWLAQRQAERDAAAKLASHAANGGSADQRRRPAHRPSSMSKEQSSMAIETKSARLTMQETEAVIDRINLARLLGSAVELQPDETLDYHEVGAMVMKYADQIIASLEYAVYGDDEAVINECPDGVVDVDGVLIKHDDLVYVQKDLTWRDVFDHEKDAVFWSKGKNGRVIQAGYEDAPCEVGVYFNVDISLRLNGSDLKVFTLESEVSS